MASGSSNPLVLTRAEIETLIGQLMPDNNAGEIDPADARRVLLRFLYSALLAEDSVVQLDPATGLVPLALLPPATAPGGDAYKLPPATETTLGGVKVGAGLDVASDGTLTAAGGPGGTYDLPAATAGALGGVKVGSGLSVTAAGLLSANAPKKDSITELMLAPDVVAKLNDAGGSAPALDYNAPLTLSATATLSDAQLGKLCYLSGASFTITLPAPGASNYNKIIELAVPTNSVGIYRINSAAGALVGGKANRLIWANESLRLQSTPAGWAVLARNSRSMSLALRQFGAPSFPGNAFSDLAFTEPVENASPGGMAFNAGGFLALREAIYSFRVFCAINNYGPSEIYLRINGSITNGSYANVPAGGQFVTVTMQRRLQEGDRVNVALYCVNGADLAVDAAHRATVLTMVETPD